MFEPVRGGTRGGQAEFKWSDVSQDKDRENYLGHSINAPTGRWQKNKDVHWYSRDVAQEESERLEEIRRLKEVEAEALAAALGFGSSKPAIPGAPASGSNAVPVPAESAKEVTESASQKEERRRLRKAEKKSRKEEKRARKSSRHYRSDPVRPAAGDRSRSRSPVRRVREDEYRTRRPRSRSGTPPARGEYDDRQRETERERDRRRWEDNSRRSMPGARWGRN